MAGPSQVQVRVWLLEAENPMADMLTAKHLCEQYATNGILSQWISPEDCLDKKELDRRDVFVMEEFSGPVFEKLSQTKATIVGPKCLSCCLNEGSEIPPGPVFTVAMKNLIITISGSGSDKSKLKKKILWMGGCCETKLTEETTHVISTTVLSEKYIKAVASGLPIMKPEWVEAVWKASLEMNISATNSQFDSYKLPIFYGIVVSTTGLSKREKKSIVSLITDNGGRYLANFEANVVDVLILHNEGAGSPKHKAAIESETICVLPSWAFKSVEKGHALDYRDFALAVVKTSSPNRPSQLPDMSLNVSTIKNVKGSNFVNDTCSTVSSDSTFMPSTLQGSSQKSSRHPRLVGVAKEFAQLIDGIEMKDVKKAGSFLDGCCVYVYGMCATRRDKVQRIVSRAGGVRYDEPVEGVTHGICGDPNAILSEAQKSSMPRANFVTVRWLVDSILASKAVDEIPYLVSNCEKTDKKSKLTMPSPMSKRNLQLLQTPVCRPPVPRFKLNDSIEENDDIVQQYRDHQSQTSTNDVTLIVPIDEEKTLDNATQEKTLDNANQEKTLDNAIQEKNTSATVKPSTDLANVEDENLENPEEIEENSTDNSADEEISIFKGITFELHDVEEEAEQITERINSAGGTVVKSGNGSSNHYILVPLNCDDLDQITEGEIVISTWLDDCLFNEALVSIEYYHRPVKSFPSNLPLAGLVFAISVYTGSERTYIGEIASLLGAIVQPSLYRGDSSTTRRSTHLICPEPSGAKYKGAVNWGLPVVTNRWLLDCLAAGRRVREGPYLLGSSVEPEWNDLDGSGKENKLHTTKQKSVDNESIQNTNKTADDVQTQMKECSNVTPGKKSMGKLISGNNAEMSPASRYIAMARQGLFTTESQETPKKPIDNIQEVSQHSDTISTPSIDNALATPNLALFSTTSKRRILAIKRGERPSNPLSTPKNPFNVSCATPESPFGAMFKTDTGRLSPTSRKRLHKFCDDLPSPVTKEPEKKETPISELRKKFFMNQLPPRENRLSIRRINIDDHSDTPPAKQQKISEKTTVVSSDTVINEDLQNQLKQLDSILTGGEGSSSMFTPRSMINKRSSMVQNQIHSTGHYMENKDSTRKGDIASQIDTVGWDDKTYTFMLSSNIQSSDEIRQIILRLGGTILDGDFNNSATHFLCSHLSRSEKLLGCLAGRKWILHPSYIIRSQEAGRFFDEELYEWGNPKSDMKIAEDSEQEKLANAVYRWRSNSSSSLPPFHSFKVIMYMQEARKKPLIRVLEAGGGKVVDISPPFENKEIDATICFIEPRRMPLPQVDLEYLASKRIPVCPSLYLFNSLINDPTPDVMDFVYPEYKELMC